MTKQWISIDAKKPEHDQKVFYFFEQVGVHRGVYKTYTDDDGQHDIFFGDAGWLTDDATHWMPCDGSETDLPAPPVIDTSEDQFL